MYKEEIKYRFQINELIDIMDQMYEGFLLSALDGRIFYANRAVEKISGFTLDKIIGKTPKEMQHNGIILEQTVRVESTPLITMIHKLSNGREVFITSKPIYHEDGKIICFAANYQNLGMLNHLKTSHVHSNKKEVHLKDPLLKTEGWVGDSKATRQLKEKVLKLAKTEALVLITGESGVGKEVVANYIHRWSNRKGNPYIQINCGAIPKDIIEAELFGYEKGAFTGADKSKGGIFESANGGTVLLDEIGEMPLNLQVKLLRVIQNKKITRVGDTKEIKLDIRFIAATNKNLEQSVQKGEFREDLYYRLNVIPLHIPPLCKRKEDILPLSQYFLEKMNKKYEVQKVLSAELLHLFLDYHWPGNVRQLENMIERIIIIAEDDNISPKYLPDEFKAKNFSEIEIKPLREVREEAEKSMIELAMQRFGTTRKAAKYLDVDHSTIVRKIKKYNI